MLRNVSTNDCGITFNSSPQEVKNEAQVLVDSIAEAITLIEGDKSNEENIR